MTPDEEAAYRAIVDAARYTPPPAPGLQVGDVVTLVAEVETWAAVLIDTCRGGPVGVRVHRITRHPDGRTTVYLVPVDPEVPR